MLFLMHQILRLLAGVYGFRGFGAYVYTNIKMYYIHMYGYVCVCVYEHKYLHIFKSDYNNKVLKLCFYLATKTPISFVYYDHRSE